jgi:hypothetical protein
VFGARQSMDVPVEDEHDRPVSSDADVLVE